MKTQKPTRILTSSIAAIAALVAFSPSSADAATGNWNVDAAGNWSAAGSWAGGIIPNAAGDIANLNFNLTAARIVTIDVASRSLGDLNIGDPTTGFFGYTLAAGAGFALILDGTAAADATVDFTGGIGNTISAPITLTDNGVFRSNVAFAQTLSGIISGAKTVTFNNDTDGTVNAATALNGQFVVTGANTYSLGTTISDVRVSVQTSNAALGTGAVTIQSGGQVYASTALTYGNVFNIAGNGWAESGTGQPYGALRLEGTATISGAVNMTANAGIGGSGTGTGTVSGVISGAGFALSKRGGTTLILSGANTYSGGTNVSGILQLNNNAAAGTGAITIDNTTATGTSTLFASKLVLNGGVTIANTLNFSGTTGTGGRGILEQTGTGLATMNGAINLTGTPSAGGHFYGGNAASNALVLGGMITSTVQVTQRDGFVRYLGGGTGYNSLGVTGTAQLGATNGISTTAATIVGLSAAGAVLDLNGFEQSLPSISLGNTGASTNSGSIALGARTLTLNGDLSSLNSGAVNVTNAVTATAGGTINFGASPRNISVGDTNALDDLRITGATLAGSGLTKTGTGTLALNGATFSTPLTVSAGSLQAGTANAVGSASLSGLTFTGTTGLKMKVGAAGDSLTVTGAGGLVASGTTTVTLNQVGGALANGTYNLINYSGTSPGLTGFTLAQVGHSTSTLIDTGTAIALSVTDNAQVIWDGTSTSVWATGVTGNWKHGVTTAVTDYIESDDVIFQDGPISANPTIATNIFPSNVTFTNTTSTPYTVSGAAGIAGPTGITKSGDGTLTLSNLNTYSGATAIQAGTLILNHSTTTPLAAASAMSVSGGATVRFTHTGGVFTLVNPISGAGMVVIDPSTTTAGNRDIATVTWNTTGMTGTLRLAPTTGTMRIAVDNPTDLGNGTVEVASGGQIFLNTASLTIPNNITISGTGYNEPTGFLGAIRSSNLDNFTGTITVNGSAKIGALGGTAIVSGTLTGGALTFGGAVTGTSAETLAITGNASGITSLTVNDGTGTAASSIAVNVGNNTATGTLGAVPVSLLADGFRNSVIRFDRTDGYTLGATVASTSAAANHLRTFIDADSQGTGFSDGGFAITLGGATAATGGSFRVGLNRANSIANISGALTAGTFLVGANALTPIANINTGANVNVGTARIATGTSINSNSTLNFNGGTFTAFSLGLGEVNSGNGIVNQTTGSTVSIDTQLRVGHFATNTSVYNMNGGALTMTGASPTLTPSTAGAGAASATGDNNINALVTPALVGGGIYLGIDGQGVFNHTGGTVTTNWIVLDNRAASGAGTNMIDGLDRYNLSGSSILNLRSNWGLLGRNEGSYVVSLGGGTIRVDNTGTGTGTGANITIPLDATMSTVASTTTTLDTNGAGNGFTLTKNANGTGTLALTGGGIVNLSTTGNQVINTGLSGSTGIAKLGAGITDLNGVNTGYVGPISVSVGRLNVNTALGAASTISVAGGATLSGEPSVTSLTLGSGTGSTLLFNPNTIGAITATTLNTPLNNVLDFSAAIPGDGTYTAISYGTKVGAGVFTVAGAANYRSVTVNNTGSAIDVVLANTKALVWLGAGGLTWDINTTSNWDDAGAPGTPEKFFQADVVTFDDLSVGATAVTVTPGVSPALTQISGTTNNYTLTSTGAGIAGGEVSKDGSTTLTLAGANTYPGKTTVSGGTVSIAVPTSLGSGATGNSIVLSNGGRLLATAGLDLGVARSLAVGTGGGVLSVTNAAAQTVTVPGNLSGAGPLTFNVATGAAGAASVFLLTGTDNTAYTGAITVNATSTALATLRLTTQGPVPSASAINLAYPAAAVTTGNATTLDLAGSVTLPLGTTLNMTANLNGAISQRSQVIGNGLSFINGPITLSGNAASVIQFAPTGGTLTINGNITEASPSSFGGGAAATLFFRAAGNTVVNGTINLPTALVSRVDDTGTLTVNSTGNVWATTDVRSNSTLRLGINNALPIAATMTIGQATDAGSSVFELNGFNQEIAGLNYVNGNGANTRRVTNSSVTASTLTINNTANFTYGSIAANGAGNLTGNLTIVKNGAGSQTFAGPVNTYTGNVTVNGGTLVAGGGAASNALGNPTLAGRTVAVNNAGSTLSFTTNNVFGNGVGNSNLPAVSLGAGTILTSTRYNAIGGLTLNGATFTQATTDAGAYEGFQFRGNVTVGGSAQSTIATTNAKANHLNANTTFTVADATTGVDLLVSAPLRNQSGDFASAAGGLTKAGSGTMELTATNTYTGATLINDGVLRVSGSISGSAVTVDGINAILGGSGTVGATTLINGGSINPGASPGILTVAGAFTMSSGTSLNIEVNGLAVGTDYDQVSVAGVVTLAGSTLNLSGSYLTTPAITNALFTIILNDGAGDAVVGAFAGINEGGHVFSGLGQDYTVSYVGGDGNDVVLTAVPEPGAITMLLGGVGMLLGLQRRRRKA